MRSIRGIQNVEFRIQKKDHSNRGNADLKSIFQPHSLFRDWLPSPGFWVLNSWILLHFPGLVYSENAVGFSTQVSLLTPSTALLFCQSEISGLA